MHLHVQINTVDNLAQQIDRLAGKVDWQNAREFSAKMAFERKTVWNCGGLAIK